MIPMSERPFDDVEVLATGLGFPEGPVAMPDGSVAVAEIRKGVVTRVSAGSVTPIAYVGGGPNGAALGPDGNLFICNNGGRSAEHRRHPCIQRIDLQSGEVVELYRDCDGRALASPNDLVFDETGMMWFTDLRGHAIYYASPDGDSIARIIDGVASPNGIGLSPGRDVLYWAQTHTRQVMRRALTGPGQVVDSPGCSIAALLEHGEIDRDAVVIGLDGVQELDSLAIEADGSICVGTLVDSGITVVDPAGFVREKFVLPPALTDGAVTNNCFGGDDRSTAFVTLSQTGRLISCRWPRPGLALIFQGTGACSADRRRTGSRRSGLRGHLA
jgi:gluconolactonase